MHRVRPQTLPTPDLQRLGDVRRSCRFSFEGVRLVFYLPFIYLAGPKFLRSILIPWVQFNDIELAEINANRPEDDDPRRKKLWLKIAKHVVKHQNDAKAALSYLKKSDVLQIEDVLPFLPDFVVIDDFKVRCLSSSKLSPLTVYPTSPHPHTKKNTHTGRDHHSA